MCVAERGCKLRCLPKRFCQQYSIYIRTNRRVKKGVLDHVFDFLLGAVVINILVDSVPLDSTTVKVYPDGKRELKNTPQAIGKTRVGWKTEIHMVATDDKMAMAFALLTSQLGGVPEG